MKIFHTLIWVVFTWMYTYVKLYWAVSLRPGHFTVCKLHLSWKEPQKERRQEVGQVEAVTSRRTLGPWWGFRISFYKRWKALEVSEQSRDMIRLTSQKDDSVCGVRSRPWWDPSGWQQTLRAEDLQEGTGTWPWVVKDRGGAAVARSWVNVWGCEATVWWWVGSQRDGPESDTDFGLCAWQNAAAKAWDEKDPRRAAGGWGARIYLEHEKLRCPLDTQWSADGLSQNEGAANVNSPPITHSHCLK